LAISYPKRSEGRAAFRRLIEAASQATPVTAALAHLYGYTHPSQFEQDIEKFQRQVADFVNDYEERIARVEAALAPHARINPLALDVALFLLRGNTTGRRELALFSDLQATFCDVSKALLEEAIAELKHLGYAETTSVLSQPIRTVQATSAMFLAFDLVATGNDTRADAVQIAGLWLENDRLTNVYELEKKLGWEPRRLNPALAALLPIFPKGRQSGELHPRLEVVSVLVTPDERFQLRRIVNTGQVD
jgi:hypothetical protein